MNNKNASPRRFLLFSSIIALAFTAQSCVSARAKITSEWKVAKSAKSDEATWAIYSRKIAGTNFLEYKIEGAVSANPEACITSFRDDIHALADSPTNKKYPVYEIVKESEDSLLIYVIHREPFPLNNTEMSVRYLFFGNEDSSTGVRWHEAWEECPIQPSKKLNRVQSFRGSWDFSPSSSQASKAVNSVRFDPKKMPLWLVEPMVFNFLKKGLRDIREKVSEKD